MLIYGAAPSQAKKAVRSHILGFVEIEARPIRLTRVVGVLLKENRLEVKSEMIEQVSVLTD